MKIIRALLLLISLGSMVSATTIVQTKTKTSYLAGDLGPMTFARFDTSLGELTGVSVGFSFIRTVGSLAVDHSGNLGGSVLFRHNLEAYMTTSTVNIGPSSIGKTALGHSQTNYTVGGNGVDDTNTFDIGAFDCSVYNAAIKNTTFATENIDADSWTNFVGTGTYDIDLRRFNCNPQRE